VSPQKIKYDPDPPTTKKLSRKMKKHLNDEFQSVAVLLSEKDTRSNNEGLVLRKADINLAAGNKMVFVSDQDMRFHQV